MANLPEGQTGTARDAVGKAIGVSGKSIDHATRILANGTPALIAAVDADRIAVSTAVRACSLSEIEQNELVHRAEEREANGFRRARPTAVSEASQPDPDTDPEARKSRGKGVAVAHQAINLLSQIPKNDGLRKRGFQIVLEWVQRNLRRM